MNERFGLIHGDLQCDWKGLSHLGDHRQRSRNARKKYLKFWRLMDSHDPERLSSVRKPMSSVRVT